MNIMAELEKLASKTTDKLTDQAKTSALKTLNDPEIKEAVNKFTRNFIEEHKVFLIAIFGSFVFLSVLATINIFSNFSQRRK